MAIFDKNKDYDKLRKDVARANKAITRIENKYGESSWGINRLYNKLDNDTYQGITKSGRIKLNKNMSDIQLKAIQKATDTFLNNKKTSTLRGIEQVKKDVKSSLKATLGDKKNQLTDSEINKLYDLVEDKDKRSMTEQIGASTIWTTITEAKERGITDIDDYYNLVEQRGNMTLNEEDKEFLEDIFLRYYS